MRIVYNDRRDLLYLQLDDREQPVINKRLSEDIVLDIGNDDRIVGIEILEASKHLNLERLLPVEYETSEEATLVNKGGVLVVRSQAVGPLEDIERQGR